MKNLGQKCAKCGKTNHTTQNHWPGGKNPNKKGKGQKLFKKSDSSGKKKEAKKGKGKEKAQTSANILSVPELAKLSIQMAQSTCTSHLRLPIREGTRWLFPHYLEGKTTVSGILQYKLNSRLKNSEVFLKNQGPRVRI